MLTLLRDDRGRLRPLAPQEKKMAKPGKKYRESVKAIGSDKSYDAAAAIDLVKATAKAKFDETVELHVAWASIRRRAIRTCAARSCCRTAPAKARA